MKLRSASSVPSNPMRTPPFPTHIKDLVPATTEQESQFLAAAKRVQSLAPWEDLEDHDVIAVRNPADGSLGFISASENPEGEGIISLHRGVEAYLGFQDLLDEMELDDPFNDEPNLGMIQLSQLQMRFSAKKNLEKIDIDLLTRHGIQVSKTGFYPCSRSICPGYFPWNADGAELQFLTIALNELADVMDAEDFSPEDLEPWVRNGRSGTSYRIFCRQTDEKETSSWKNHVLIQESDIPQLDDSEFRHLVKAIRKKPKAKDSVEVALGLLPIPTGGDDTRPFLPGAIVVCRGDRVLGSHFTDQGFARRILPELLSIVLEILAGLPTRPEVIRISDPRLTALDDLSEELGIEVSFEPGLDTADEAMEAMFLEAVEEVRKALRGKTPRRAH